MIINTVSQPYLYDSCKDMYQPHRGHTFLQGVTCQQEAGNAGMQHVLKPSNAEDLEKSVECNMLMTSLVSKLLKLLAQMLHPSAVPWCRIIDFTIRIKVVIRKIISALLELFSSACIDRIGF